ncbi:urea amidolyase related protein [Psychromonas ingrahamii 37]|uniref:Urea amidolyase related protein n=1 Tax=Psychromonas ingrahamii (strain DSM 17664 / CCUG 51855 / 37) TaxID=357804 RepID=A1T0G7_PSYIN|nr:biotin-dependent carboxyltransferase family protein [Psychromonas ingrahamii]ABM05232.1 urea amidolyase related protein [Psychromonas ingrahamii 37]
MSKLKVIQPGMLSLIQDVGRFGVAQLGLSQGGPIDLHAYCWANHLLANSMHCPVLEITLGQASFTAQEDTMVALTGANMMATLDGVAHKNWCSFQIKKGQTLKLGFAQTGLRAYLAIAGGFAAQKIFGSSATVMRNKLGGLAKDDDSLARGNKIAAGQLLTAASINQHRTVCRSVPKHFIPDYADTIEIGVLPSYQVERFPQLQRDRFFQSSFAVSPQSDRMGVRLTGAAIKCDTAGIISEGIALGAIQIPPDGQPIILLNDRQTLGGYPKIGCVSRLDLPKIAQARAGSVIRFYDADIEEKSSQWCEFLGFFNM